MNDYDSDQGRELRRARLLAVRPRHSSDTMPEAEYETMYRRFQIVRREYMLSVEENLHVMFCPACQEEHPNNDALVKARKLFTSYDEDPLRNFRALVTLRCEGCGWNEIIPLDSAPALPEEDAKAIREAEARQRIDKAQAHMNTFSPQLYSDEMLKRYQQALTAPGGIRQLGKSAMLGAAYGMGQQKMRSLMSGRIGNITGVSTAMLGTSAPPSLRGQELADSIWEEYDLRAKEATMAADARRWLAIREENDRLRTEMARQAADHIATAIDKEVLDTIKPGKIIKVAPPPKLDANDKAAMREMLIEEVKRADGDAGKIRAAIDRLKEFFR